MEGMTSGAGAMVATAMRVVNAILTIPRTAFSRQG
jgi:hypothetical protein